MNDGLDFDYEEFKGNAKREHFYGQVIQHWQDGKLVRITIEQSYQVKDFDKLNRNVFLNRNFL